MRLLALIAAVTAVAVVSVVGIAAAVGGDPQPPPAKPLSEAIHDALVAKPVQGVTARIEFKNDLVGAGAFEGVSPLISGASGRLWWTADHLRLELQGRTGDVQVVADPQSFWVYDGASHTVYRGSIPADKQDGKDQPNQGVPTIAQIETKLSKALEYVGIAGPDPGVEAGQSAYSVKVTPKKNGGLVGAVGLAWDAAHGVPLRIGVYPKGSDSPVVELKATDITFGAVDSSAFAIAPPQGAKVVDLGTGKQSHEKVGKHDRAVTGARAVQAKLPFTLKAPETLAGRKLRDVRLVSFDGRPGAVSAYGDGLDSIWVVQRQYVVPNAGGKGGHGGGVQLGSADVNGATASVLETPLGSGLEWTAGSVTYVVAGSVTRDVAEAAARGL